MIKAVFFDFYGVLTPDPFKIFLDIAAKKSPDILGQTQEVIRKYFFGVCDSEFLASSLRIILADSTIHGGLFVTNMGQIDRNFYGIARMLKVRQLKIGILGNLGTQTLETLQYINKNYPTLDSIVSPMDTGTTVQSAEIFAHALSEVSSKPEEALYVSANQENLAYAMSIGIESINYVGVEALQRELEEKLR